MPLDNSRKKRVPGFGATPLRVDRPYFGGPVPISTLSDACIKSAGYTEFLSKQFKAPASFVFARLDLSERDTTNLVDLRAGMDDGLDNDVKTLAKELSRHVLDMEHPLVVTDTNSHPLLVDTRQWGKNPSFAAYLGAPIRNRSKQVVGVICVADQKMRPWSDVELRFLSVIAEELGSKLG